MQKKRQTDKQTDRDRGEIKKKNLKKILKC